MPDQNSDIDKARLERLDEKLKAARQEQQLPASPKKDYSALSLAWRMVIELISGVGIGFFIGYGLDSLFGTMPIFLMIFLMFGLAAGIRTMMRTAKEVERLQREAFGQSAPRDEDKTGGN